MTNLLVYLIPILMAFGAASSGWMRVAARSYRILTLTFLALSVSACACYLIAATKTGTFLVGLMGTLLAMLLAVGAAGLISGAILRGLHEWMHLRIKHEPAPRRVAPSRPWDMLALVTMSVLAIGLSVME